MWAKPPGRRSTIQRPCNDCRALDSAMRGSSHKLLRGKFEVVQIDVGNFDRNLDLVQRYGNPIKKGIPAAVIFQGPGPLCHAGRRAGGCEEDGRAGHLRFSSAENCGPPLPPEVREEFLTDNPMILRCAALRRRAPELQEDPRSVLQGPARGLRPSRPTPACASTGYR
jgi:hypothetical protein